MNYSRYKHLAIERAKDSPTEEEIAAIEKLLGAMLPASFREYLNVANGGYLEYDIDIEFADGKSEALSFCGLFSAEDGNFGSGTFAGEIISCRENMKMPEGVLPFAVNGGGSMVFLDLTDEGKGRVVAFVYGLPAWTGLRTETSFIQVADSFDDYVSKLYIDRGAVLDHLRHDASQPSHVAATEEWLDIGLPDWRTDREICDAMAEAKLRVTT